MTGHSLFCSARLTLCVFVFFGLTILYTQRINLGFAIVWYYKRNFFFSKNNYNKLQKYGKTKEYNFIT